MHGEVDVEICINNVIHNQCHRKFVCEFEEMDSVTVVFWIMHIDIATICMCLGNVNTLSKKCEWTYQIPNRILKLLETFHYTDMFVIILTKRFLPQAEEASHFMLELLEKMTPVCLNVLLCLKTK